MAAKTKVDPFDTAPFDTAPDQNDTGGDEAQADIDSAPGVGQKPVNPLVVVPSAEGKVTVTLKGGLGFNAPWVVIHSADVSDALNQLSDTNLPALLEKAQGASKYFAMFGDAKPASNTSTAASGQPAAAAAGSGGNVKTCKHGQMVARAGVKNGKAWSGHFCPTPQGTPDQCKPQFDR